MRRSRSCYFQQLKKRVFCGNSRCNFPKEAPVDQEVNNEERIYTVVGTGRSGFEWEDVFAKENKFGISNWARQAIADSDYDARHRFALGKKYKVRLLFMRDITDASHRRIEEMNKLASYLCGKKSSVRLKAELAFLLRERFTNHDLRELNITRIIVPHCPLRVYDDELCWLRVDSFDDKASVGTESAEPGALWDERAAFA